MSERILTVKVNMKDGSSVSDSVDIPSGNMNFAYIDADHGLGYSQGPNARIDVSLNLTEIAASSHYQTGSTITLPKMSMQNDILMFFDREGNEVYPEVSSPGALITKKSDTYPSYVDLPVNILCTADNCGGIRMTPNSTFEVEAGALYTNGGWTFYVSNAPIFRITTNSSCAISGIRLKNAITAYNHTVPQNVIYLLFYFNWSTLKFIS